MFIYLYKSHVLGILELHPILVIGQFSRNSSLHISRNAAIFCAVFLTAVCDLCTYSLDSMLYVRCVHILGDAQLSRTRSLWIIYWCGCLCAQPRKKKRLWWCERGVWSLCVVVAAVCWCVMWCCNILRLVNLMVEMMANSFWNACWTYEPSLLINFLVMAPWCRKLLKLAPDMQCVL